MGGQLVGREAERAVLAGFLESTGAPRALLLTGGAGIGKSALWEAGLELAAHRGMRVLAARGSSAEKQLSFAALIDLLDGVGGAELADLPAPQQHALEVALLRTAPERTSLPPAAVNVGVLSALRSLAGAQTLLVAIDDVQWIDTASVETLVFALRRLEDQPVRFLLAQRSRRSSILERAFGPRGLERVDVGPLDLASIRRMLAERLGLSLSRHALYRILDASLGNPLFALELGRALADRPPLGISDEVPFPETVDELLGTRVAGLDANVRRLLLAASLSRDLRTARIGEIVDPAALDDAVDAGVVAIDGDRVRPAHPLFAAAARRSARARDRRELHLALARLAGDRESRSLHLALATHRPDEALAQTLAAAASAETARGARRDAVLFAEHALRLTPAGSPERHDRVLALGTYLATAGEAQRITDLLVPELDALPRGAARASALRLLADGVVADNDEIRHYLAEAFEESADDAPLRAEMLVELAENDAVILVRRIPEAERVALDALALRARDDGQLERTALYCLAWARALGGRGIDDLCEQFGRAVDGAQYVSASPERVAGQRLFWRGEVDAARAALSRLLTVADERGESYSYVLQRLHLCQLELRIGNWDAAARHLDEWAESSERVMWPMYERCRALLAAGRGLPDETERWAKETLDKAAATGTQWDRLEALRARGLGALLRHDVTRAVESLRPVWAHTQAEGVGDPGVFPVAPDLIEALAEEGSIDEAATVTAELRELAVAQNHPWGLASTSRGGALVAFAGAPDEGATDALAAAASDYGRLGLRFDRARTLLVLGRAQRRWRKWGAARRTLEEALDGFRALGSTGWAEDAAAELARVGARRPKPESDALTATEQRVAELAADGLANKEIAQQLFVSVRTVEVHLKRAYAKLGIRSRAQLARRLSDGAPSA